MKHIITILIVCYFISFSANAQHKLTRMWATDTVLAIPESVLCNGDGNVLYVSLINGQSDMADGRGGVAKLTVDGRIIDTNWCTGLNAPKGIGMFGNKLYVADLTEVAVIDITTGRVIKRIPVEGAKFLNDVTVDSKGVIYVSDTQTGKVHKIENNTVTTYLENLKSPNGLLAVGNNLYVLANGSLLSADNNKSLHTIAEGMDASTDGIEQVKPGEFIVSCWAGVVYYVKADGSKQQLLDTKAEKFNSADIGYNAKTKTVFVPTFFKKGVIAYHLK